MLASCALSVPSPVLTIGRNFNGWWLKYIVAFTKKNKRIASGAIIYIIWWWWEREGESLEGAKESFHESGASFTGRGRIVRNEIELLAFAFTDGPEDRFESPLLYL